MGQGLWMAAKAPANRIGPGQLQACLAKESSKRLWSRSHLRYGLKYASDRSGIWQSHKLNGNINEARHWSWHGADARARLLSGLGGLQGLLAHHYQPHPDPRLHPHLNILPHALLQHRTIPPARHMHAFSEAHTHTHVLYMYICMQKTCPQNLSLQPKTRTLNTPPSIRPRPQEQQKKPANDLLRSRIKGLASYGYLG